MARVRVVVVAASVASLLVSAGCLPTYVWEEESPKGNDETDDGGGGSTPQGFQCPSIQGLRATHGPYGAERLYFGDPEIDPSLPEPYGTVGGSVSPDGLHFVQGISSKRVLETPRLDMFSSWQSESSYPPDYTFFELHPRLSGDGKALYSCNGGEMECMVHTRPTTAPAPTNKFDPAFHFQDIPPFYGPGSDFAFTPTPEGRFLAFASNRVSADDDSDGADDLDLWIASADPRDGSTPPRHYIGLEKLTASIAGEREEPSWLSDSGRTLIFYRGPEDERDLFIVDRADAASPFGAEVMLPMSQPGTSEQELTLPSIATLEIDGCGFAYYEVIGPTSSRAWMRVPVCIGAPCEP